MSLGKRLAAATGGERGMSIIELSVVLALIGMMAFIGLPTMQEWLDRYRVRTAASEIAANIQLQRMRAVSQNVDHSIAFDEDAGTYSLFRGDPATGTNLDAVAHSLPNSVLFAGGADPIDTPSDEIIFHPDGSLNDSTATLDQIFLRNSQGDVFAISVNRATGRVQVQLQSSGY